MTIEEFRKLKYAGHIKESNGYTYSKYYPPNSCNTATYSRIAITPGDIFCKKEKEHYIYYICTSVLSHFSEIRNGRVDKEYALSKLVFEDTDEYEVYTIVNDTDENFLSLREHKNLHGTLDLRTKLVATIPNKHYIVLTNRLKYKENKKEED